MDMSLQPLGSKRYVEMATQTEPSTACSGCGQISHGLFPLGTSRATTPSEVPETVSFSDDERSTDQRAYIHGLTSKLPFNVEPLASCADRKLWIDCNRPSALSLSIQSRMVSLPNPLPPTTVKAEFEARGRIVTMPERGAHSNFSIGQKLALSSQLDSPEHSLDSWESPGSTSGRDQRRPYPYDLPQTPSPPSSPDSVMIIGNNTQVSGSFLKRTQEDEHGWITWASSPPRPIPALHGPLSLPYARCPSGAEGTIVEGDDLSRRVWGLGSNDTQPDPQKKFPQTPNLNKNAALPEHPAARNNVYSQPRTSAIQHGKSAIDLPTNPSSQELAEAPSYARLQGPTQALDSTGHTQSFVSFSQGRPVQPSNVSESSTSRIVDLQSFISSNLTYRAAQVAAAPNETMRQHKGLGLNLQTILGSGDGPTYVPAWSTRNEQSHLNSTAPAFVPASHRSKRSVYTHPENDFRHEIIRQQSNQMEYRHATNHNLPTPPSTASPRWAPSFSRHDDLEQSTRTLAMAQHSSAPRVQDESDIYSPRMDIHDYSQTLLRLVQQMSNLGLDGSPRDDLGIAHLVAKSQPSHNGFLTHTHIFKNPSQEGGLMSAPTIPQTIPIDFVPMEEARTPETPYLNQPPASSERRRQLSYQQPRSIPLARLIQRRLSSVPEEEMLSSKYDLSVLKNVRSNDLQVSFAAESRSLDASDRLANVSTSTVTGVDDRHDGAESNARVRLPGKLNARFPTQSGSRDGCPSEGVVAEKENINQVGSSVKVERKLRQKKRS